MDGSWYGLWSLVALDTALFAVFAASSFHPRTRRDWPAVGAFTGFLVSIIYRRLARREDREIADRLGGAWAGYAARTPAFIPAATAPSSPEIGPLRQAGRAVTRRAFLLRRDA